MNSLSSRTRSITRTNGRLPLLILGLVAAACSEDAGGPAGPSVPSCVVTAVIVAPSPAIIAVGQSTSLTATITSANCTAQPVVTWTSASAAVGVQPNGNSAQVTGVSTGVNVVVTASAGGQSGSALVTVTAPLPSTIVFTTGSGSSRDLWRMDPNGTNIVRLTNNTSSDYSATFGPGGAQIGYVRSGSLYRMASDGANPTFVTGATNQVFTPAWSPDGSMFAYCDFVGDFFTGTCPLKIVTVAGVFVRTIGTAGRYQADPDWSPDGQSIIYADGSSPLGCCDIRRSPVAGGATQVLFDSTTFAGNPVYSPDGSRIAFHVNFQIVVMNAAGGPITVLTPDSVTASYPTWSIDGTRIAYRAEMPGQTTSDIWVMNADGSNKVNITNTPAINETQTRWGIKVAGSLPVQAGLRADAYERAAARGSRPAAPTREARVFDGMLSDVRR